MVDRKRLTLEEWDETVGPHLKIIELSSSWISYYTNKVVSAAVTLAGKPEWDTKAQNELDRAIKKMERALDTLKVASATYAAKESLVEK